MLLFNLTAFSLGRRSEVQVIDATVWCFPSGERSPRCLREEAGGVIWLSEQRVRCSLGISLARLHHTHTHTPGEFGQRYTYISKESLPRVGSGPLVSAPVPGLRAGSPRPPADLHRLPPARSPLFISTNDSGRNTKAFHGESTFSLNVHQRRRRECVFLEMRFCFSSGGISGVCILSGQLW